MDPTEPHWRINSSFSPPLSRRWDCRFRSDGASHGTRGAHVFGSSVSSLSKGSRSMLSNDQYPNHHHSVSDGALSYFGSPYDNFQAPRWTPPARRYDLGEFSTPSGGSKKYQIKGCAGEGAFAQVYKGYSDSKPDSFVALKVQEPPCPWEFYMYRQLDKRMSDIKRSSFGFAHELHIYSDCSILVCDYLSRGTLQDAINSYLVKETYMEEVVCMYYTIEMLDMLEVLHDAGIIHGDFKPDNLLVRCARDELTEEGFRDRTGPWRDQGLCLVDWGKGIDVNLFPAGTEFYGDCRTSGFRCIEMQENKPWTYQTDLYALCVNVHMMLHGAYMNVEKKSTPDGSYHYQPETPLKSHWNAELWKKLFWTLLNIQSDSSDVMLLGNLKKSFNEYICSNPQRIKELTAILAKVKASWCSG